MAKNHRAFLNQLPGQLYSQSAKNQPGKILPNVTPRTSYDLSSANLGKIRVSFRNMRSSVPRSRPPAIKPGKGFPPILRATAYSDPIDRRYASLSYESTGRSRLRGSAKLP